MSRTPRSRHSLALVVALVACGPGFDAAVESDAPDVDVEQSALDAPHRPNAITALTYAPGPTVGTVTLRWTHDGKYTTGFVLETGLTSFSKTNPELPTSGRHARFLKIARGLRTITLTAAQVTEDGAPVGSGNHLYFRLSAENTDASGATSTRYYPYLRAVLPLPEPPTVGHRPMRVASFNVRTARALSDARSWLQRAPDVAAQIVQYNPGLVAIQELGPGRADGQSGTLDGHIRQTDSLLQSLDAASGSRYDLVRTTPYVVSGTTTGTQGMRILFDNSRYVLRSVCPDTTDGRKYSPSCSFKLPILPGDTESRRRRAVYAKFEELASGKALWFVSVHFDERHDDDPAVEATYDALRKSQADTVNTQMNVLNTAGLPIVIAGDFNAWQNNRVGNSPHDTLIAKGYDDLSAAKVRKNFQYATINHFDLTLNPAAQGVGVRIDAILVKGTHGAASFENVMKVADAARPSDHNMIVADFAPFAL